MGAVHAPTRHPAACCWYGQPLSNLRVAAFLGLDAGVYAWRLQRR